MDGEAHPVRHTPLSRMDSHSELHSCFNRNSFPLQKRMVRVEVLQDECERRIADYRNRSIISGISRTKCTRSRIQPRRAMRRVFVYRKQLRQFLRRCLHITLVEPTNQIKNIAALRMVTNSAAGIRLAVPLVLLNPNAEGEVVILMLCFFV